MPSTNEGASGSGGDGKEREGAEHDGTSGHGHEGAGGSSNGEELGEVKHKGTGGAGEEHEGAEHDGASGGGHEGAEQEKAAADEGGPGGRKQGPGRRPTKLHWRRSPVPGPARPRKANGTSTTARHPSEPGPRRWPWSESTAGRWPGRGPPRPPGAGGGAPHRGHGPRPTPGRALASKAAQEATSAEQAASREPE